MTSVILISTVAIVVAIVGCFFIWKLDAERAEEIEHTAPAPAPQRDQIAPAATTTPPPPSLS